MVRIKERYLLVNIIYPPDAAVSRARVPALVAQHQPTIAKLTPQALVRAIKAEVLLLYGDYGAGALEGNLSVKYLSLATSTFILRCNRAHYQLLWSALTFMDRVPVKDGRPCIFRVVRVSGTIRKIEEIAVERARKLILEVKAQASSNPQASLPMDLLAKDDAMLEVVDSAVSDEDMEDGS
ncbi:Ribonuclease P [Trichoderma simmonsii]|uniref:Ribonuclease P/MRP protein subunit POP5 n=1 Tax=Trichoderma simmonsii TaxID=1491479 RepID=A0A8G0PAD5_9HYPO|nr:Ribonuclease P [Trichoderma simmonsii]